jgi:hypothetical protein
MSVLDIKTAVEAIALTGPGVAGAGAGAGAGVGGVEPAAAAGDSPYQI